MYLLAGPCKEAIFHAGLEEVTEEVRHRQLGPGPRPPRTKDRPADDQGWDVACGRKRAV